MPYKEDSTTDIVYLRYTNSSAESGFATGSEDPISLMNLIKNSILIIETAPANTPQNNDAEK